MCDTNLEDKTKPITAEQLIRILTEYAHQFGFADYSEQGPTTGSTVRSIIEEQTKE